MSNKRIDVKCCLEEGIYTSKELQVMTGLSQQGVSRQLGVLGSRVVRVSNGRYPRYGLACNAFGAGDDFPLVMFDLYGNNTVVGYLRPLATGGYFVERCTGGTPLLLGCNQTGLFEGLPYFLQDLLPKGFMGQMMARVLAEQSNDYPENPEQWNSDHIGRYLLSHGVDLQGNLRLGDAGLERRREIPLECSRDDYSTLADRALAGECSGTPLNGEQPKFTAYSIERKAHVVVKFSPGGTDAVASRWRDILITEYHAAETLRSGNVPAAEVELFERNGRLFLESSRLDRVGQHGRASILSLEKIVGEYLGETLDWPDALRQLMGNKLVSVEHLYDACVLWEFGYLINNTDMHPDNMSLGMEGEIFRILPAYDMCSMGFAPIRGEVKPLSFKPKVLASPLNCLRWSEASQLKVLKLASIFWERVAADSRVSDEFRAFLSQSPLDVELEPGCFETEQRKAA